MRPRWESLHTKQDFAPVLPPPDGVTLDHPADSSSRIYRTVRIECRPERLAEGARIFGNLLGFYTRQVGGLGSITPLTDGSVVAVIGIHGENKIDPDTEIVVELEPEEHQAMPPVPQRNIFDFTAD